MELRSFKELRLELEYVTKHRDRLAEQLKSIEANTWQKISREIMGFCPNPVELMLGCRNQQEREDIMKHFAPFLKVVEKIKEYCKKRADDLRSVHV